MDKMIHEQDNFTERDLKLVRDAENTEQAQSILLDILKNSQMSKSKSPIHPQRISYLIYQTKKAKTVEQVYGILLNMFLSGEGLGLHTGTYQKMMPSWKEN
jgi:hypothetical protein